MSTRMQTRSMTVKVEEATNVVEPYSIIDDSPRRMVVKPKKQHRKVLTRKKAQSFETKKTNLKKVNTKKRLLTEDNNKKSLPMLNFDKSRLLPTEELRGKLEMFLGEHEDGLKYLTYDEFICETFVQEEILNHIKKSRKIIVITGAGISCNAGIPDFRSSEGLYNKNIGMLKGKDMFDISIFRNYDSIKMFNKFIQDLYFQVKDCQPTSTHEFIKTLNDTNKLIKCYTQNIDGIERKLGLKTQFDSESWKENNVIQLHGDLHELCCNLCHEKYSWTEFYDENGEFSNKFDVKNDLVSETDVEAEEEGDGYDSDLMILSQGSTTSECSEGTTFSNNRGINDYESDIENDNTVGMIECPKCIKKYHERVSKGKRSLESSIGIIRPNIVLYGEEHPYSEKFGVNISKDLKKKPSLLLVFGTSLKVTGVKKIVREMSKKVHENGGIVVLINREAVSNSQWKNYIDYQIVSDCDAFCEFITQKMSL
ncbi:hypothetical protein CANINC_004005 [Pichia inconspicua]|uniref:Deacetylase sirtuin-type domain-containing protein n=1 Tax=Pichia inconspicua TaxID=52247 RepID=A0A4T0WYG0_9ASCO|nr:hypothetical protein CANINC_004005 [[Candida] inconspicua]